MTDIFLLVFLISVMGAFIFAISAIITFFKRKKSKDEWNKMFLFLILAAISFVLFGLSL